MCRSGDLICSTKLSSPTNVWLPKPSQLVRLKYRAESSGIAEKASRPMSCGPTNSSAHRLSVVVRLQGRPAGTVRARPMVVATIRQPPLRSCHLGICQIGHLVQGWLDFAALEPEL